MRACGGPLLPWAAAFTAVLALCGVARGSGLDKEYQRWAAAVFDEEDEEALANGREVSCYFCHIALQSVRSVHQINMARKRANRYTEEEQLRVLLALCEKMAPNIAAKMKSIKEDALMNCRRVMREQGPHMQDAASLGEKDLHQFCVESKMCSDDQKHIFAMANKIVRVATTLAEERGEL